jgi:TetR/AcrR family transcriptional repressor of lmrAB and yxaGH operons
MMNSINYDDRHSQGESGRHHGYGGRVSNDIKQRMIDETVMLLATKGLQGASFSEVLQASGAPRGSIYHHFPDGKEQLVLAALDSAGALALAFLDKLAGRPAEEVVLAFLGLWRTILERSAFNAGCAVLAVTVAADSPALLERAAAVFQGWRETLAERLAEGGVARDQAPPIAALLISACEGAVALSRAERSFEPFDETASLLGSIVAAAKSRAQGQSSDS